ncbi:MAG: HD domain-containing protein [Epulopiscium sp.]|nr:HD domain-containing protein [Candidatus Epulonipiscium sp.]
MDKERFSKQLQFLIEIDKMKTILRQNVLIDQSKQENDAEHSWHFAVMALILSEYADSKEVNINRVLKMALLHDLVEIYAGDTFAFDEKANEDKLLRETEAADKLFGLLPLDQGTEYRLLWEEFDAMETPDAIYAAAIDRFQPFILNYMTQGHTWKLGNVTSAKVYKRLEMVKYAMPKLWETIEFMVQDSIEKGYLAK